MTKDTQNLNINRTTLYRYHNRINLHLRKLKNCENCQDQSK